MGQGDVDRSLKEMEKIWDQLKDPSLDIPNKQKVDVHKVSAKSLLTVQRFDEANIQLEKGLVLEPRNHNLLFLKAQILIESQADFEEGRKLLRLVKRGKNISVKDKINAILRHRSEEANAQLFIAFVLLAFDSSKKEIEPYLVKLKNGSALKSNENVKGPDGYKEIGLYILKAYYFSKQNEEENAAINFYEAARRYNWQGAVEIARFYFSEVKKWIQTENFDWEKALEVDPDFIQYLSLIHI